MSNVNFDIEKELQSFIQQGYTTVFVFKNANVQKIVDEIREFSSDSFIFLKSIQECFISIQECFTQNYIMKRITVDGIECFSIQDTSWRIMRSKSAALAFKEENCILRSLADSDAFQSGRCAAHNGRPETLAIIN